MGAFQPTGVNHVLVRKVRDALDAAGHERVKIVASGGFTPEKIRDFERLGVPVDAYGVGSSLLRGENDFTADIVLVDGKPCAKVGRRYRPNPRLETVEYPAGSVFDRIDHIGVAVEDLDAAIELYRRQFEMG